ncbi:MAG: HAMP domain-containing sensor histidine kinase [Pseudomonadota bacterium]
MYWPMMSSLSGRFLFLTMGFVMLAEILIFVPSVARFRLDYLQERLERAQIASLALLATPDDMVAPDLGAELLQNAEVLNIVLRRNAVRELILATPAQTEVAATFDLTDPSPFELMRDAMRCLMMDSGRVVRVIGRPVKGAGLEIEITIDETPLKEALMAYGARIFLLSAMISILTAALLFLSARRFIVRPISRVVANMTAFREDPEDPARIIDPQSSAREIADAERALSALQMQLQTALKERQRLAALGGAVAKISHDLRNILTTTQILADRIGSSADPAVARAAPKLLSSLDRAINLCERTLTFGKAEEPEPEKRTVVLRDLVREALEAETLTEVSGLSIVNDVPETLRAEADPEQFFRVLQNLLRNARQAIEAMGRPGEIRVGGTPLEQGTEVVIHDTGPGLPSRAVEHLFQPFQGAVRRGGSGLGLAIAAEIVRNHGGVLELVDTSTNGTTFRIRLPRGIESAGRPAEISQLQTYGRAVRERRSGTGSSAG